MCVIQDVVLKTHCFLIIIDCNCYFWALLSILWLVLVFTVTRVIVEGSLIVCVSIKN